MGRPRLNPADATPASAGDAKPGAQETAAANMTAAIDTQSEPGKNDSVNVSDNNAPVYIVAPGRTLTVGLNKKTLRPGDPVSLDMDEMRQLHALGFIVVANDNAASGGGVAVGTLKVIGGRKPGGVVA